MNKTNNELLNQQYSTQKQLAEVKNLFLSQNTSLATALNKILMELNNKDFQNRFNGKNTFKM